MGRFARADLSLDQDAFCTAYINFIHQDDIYIFQERFDGYVFVDNKGNEYVALVEFAPNQKVNAQKESKKKDPKINTIEQDPDYIKFLEMLERKPENENTAEKTLEEIEQRERELRAGGGLENQITPLLQFMKEKKEEKNKKREEMKEQRRKKEGERRKIKEEERLKRKENKEKEIKEREKRDKEKNQKRKMIRNLHKRMRILMAKNKLRRRPGRKLKKKKEFKERKEKKKDSERGKRKEGKERKRRKKKRKVKRQ